MESLPPPTFYKRKYADAKTVSTEDLQTAYEAAAQLVAEHGDKYLPLFERLDNEVQSCGDKDRTRRRALELAESAHSPKPPSP